jgi:hypothetical protein
MSGPKDNPADERLEGCGRPCPPDHQCEECAEYWQRMVSEGLWDPERGWTDKTMLGRVK